MSRLLFSEASGAHPCPQPTTQSASFARDETCTVLSHLCSLTCCVLRLRLPAYSAINLGLALASAKTSMSGRKVKHLGAALLAHSHARRRAQDGNPRPTVTGCIQYTRVWSERRGGAKSGDHVDILGNRQLLDELLALASGHYEEVPEHVVSNIGEIASKIPL